MDSGQAVVQKTPWSVGRDTPKRRILGLLLVSLLLHGAVFTPLGALLGLLGLLARPKTEPLPLEIVNAIPISLLSPEEAAALVEPTPATDPETIAAAKELLEDMPAEPRPVSKPKTPQEDPTKKKPPKKEPAKVADAGAGAPKATKPAAKAVEQAGPKVAAKDTSAPIRDPSTMVGAASKIADSNANVELLILTERIRGHILGQRIGALLGALPQWNSFLGSSGLDAVRDLDRIYITGPQLRHSEEVMAILQYNAPQPKLRAAIDVLVKRSKNGKWLEANFPAAIARADGADRLFALPKPRLAIVSPLAARASVLADGPKISLPNPGGKEAVVADIRTPWRVLLGTDFTLPKSLKSAKLSVTPNADGGAILRFLAEDADEDAARQSSKAISRTLNDLSSLNGFGPLLSLIGLGGAPLIDRVELVADGKLVRGEVKLKPEQLKRILDLLELFGPRAREAPQRPLPAAPKETEKTPKPPAVPAAPERNEPKVPTSAPSAPASPSASASP